MLPAHFIGSLMTADGPAPFVLDTATGRLQRGCWAVPDRAQRAIGKAERAAAERQVRRAAGKGCGAVRLGAYCCPQCGRWIEVVAHPADWHGDRCAACG